MKNKLTHPEEPIEKYRSLEHLHIPLWLIKDTCWMLDYKVLGTIMVFPTVLMALFLALKTHKTKEFFMNISVLCWISANAFWMCSEFYEWGKIKFWAILPFSLGMVFIVVFFVKNRKLL